MIGEYMRTPKTAHPLPSFPRPRTEHTPGRSSQRTANISENLNKRKAPTRGFTAYAVPGAAE